MKDAPLLESRVCQYEQSPDEHLIIDRHPAAANVWLVVASNAGSFRHPAWFLNLAKHPDRVWINVGDRRVRVIPEPIPVPPPVIP